MPTNYLSEVEYLSEQAYLSLCDIIFSRWAKVVKKNKDLARRLRSLLKGLHSVYAKQCACPVWYAEYFLDRLKHVN